MGSDSDSSGGGGGGDGGGGGIRVRGLVVKALVVVGGVLLLKRLRKSTTRWDHARVVADALSGEKFSREQARRDPDSYFNIRMLTCPATEMVDGSKVLYFEQAFWRTPEKPFRQEKLWTLYLPNTIIEEVAAENRSRSEPKLALNIGRNDVVVDLAATSFPRDDVAVDLAGRRFYMVKPCPKEMKCDVELSSYAIRDVEEYKNFCDRPKDQRPQPEEVIGDIAEHLTTMHLSRCERGKRCLYEGSTPPGGFPNSWNGATHCTSDVTIYKNGELHTWDKGYDDEGNQVWGPKAGPYEFKPAPQSSYDDMFSSLNFTPSLSLEKKMDSPYVINEQ